MGRLKRMAAKLKLDTAKSLAAKREAEWLGYVNAIYINMHCMI
jgi:hypothetical protein